MRKKTKKILFVTDDFNSRAWKIRKKFIKPGNIYYDKKSNWLKFNFDVVQSINEVDNRKKYDAVLIDYGLLGDNEK